MDNRKKVGSYLLRGIVPIIIATVGYFVFDGEQRIRFFTTFAVLVYMVGSAVYVGRIRQKVMRRGKHLVPRSKRKGEEYRNDIPEEYWNLERTVRNAVRDSVYFHRSFLSRLVRLCEARGISIGSPPPPPIVHRALMPIYNFATRAKRLETIRQILNSLEEK